VDGSVNRVAVRFQALVMKWLGLQRDDLCIIDTSTALLAILSVRLYNPLPCREARSKPSENHLKYQLWAKIFSDAFILNEFQIEPA